MPYRFLFLCLLACQVLFLSGCAGTVVPLATDNPPALTPLEGNTQVPLCVKLDLKTVDGLVYQRDTVIKEFDPSRRYSLPLLTVMDTVLEKKVNQAFSGRTSDPLEICTLVVSFPVAEFSHKGAGRQATFWVEAQTKLVDPNGQTRDRKRFRAIKNSFFDGANVPEAVWKASDDLSSQIVKYYTNSRSTLALTRHFSGKKSTSRQAAAAPPSYPRQDTPGYMPRRPEIAGILPEDLEQSVASQNRWRALLIGISDYSQSEGFAGSLNDVPKKDVLRIKQLLEEDFGFSETITLIDNQATRKGILSALTFLHDSATPEDNILIYYAGHGLLPSHGVGVWVPYDAKSQEDGISNSEIKDRLANLPSRRVLLVSDSCFSGSFLTRSISLVPKNKVVKLAREGQDASALIARNRRVSREVVTSGFLNPVPNTGYGPFSSNSPFAGALLTALESARTGAVLSTRDIFNDVAHNMQQSSERGASSPQKSTLTGHGGGEFFFLKKGSI